MLDDWLVNIRPTLRQRIVQRLTNNVFKVLYGEVLELPEEEVQKEKRIWVREWLKRRHERGASA